MNDVEKKIAELATRTRQNIECAIQLEFATEEEQTTAELNIAAALRDMHDWDEEQHERQRDELREALRAMLKQHPGHRWQKCTPTNMYGKDCANCQAEPLLTPQPAGEGATTER